MKLEKALNRDRKRKRRRYGMREDGRSVKYIRKIQKERAEQIKLERQKAEAIAELTFNVYEAIHE